MRFASIWSETKRKRDDKPRTEKASQHWIVAMDAKEEADRIDWGENPFLTTGETAVDAENESA